MMVLARHRFRQAHGGPVKDESGFTLVELLSVMMLVLILMTLGASALRRYWFSQALVGSRDEVIGQLRAQQEESRTTAPKVFGARFTSGSSEWQLIQYDADAPVDDWCQVLENRTMEAGTVVESVEFDSVLTDPAERSQCLDAATDLVLFYARGSATPGEVTLYQPVVDKRASVCVTGLTGRVDPC